MCVVKAQDRLVRCTLILAIHSVIANILDDEVVAGHMQRAATRAAVHASMSKAVFNVLLNNGNLNAPIATFVSSHVEIELTRVMKAETLDRSKRKIREIAHSPSASDPMNECGIPSKEKKNRCIRLKKKKEKKSSSSTSLLLSSPRYEAWSVTSSVKSNKTDNLWSLSITTER